MMGKLSGKTPSDKEIKKLEKKETAAVENFKKIAKEAIDIIQENHFHLRLQKAVKGDK